MNNNGYLFDYLIKGLINFLNVAINDLCCAFAIIVFFTDVRGQIFIAKNISHEHHVLYGNWMNLLIAVFVLLRDSFS